MSNGSTDSNTVVHLIKQGNICFEKGEYTNAVKSWEEALGIKHDDALLLKLAAVSWHQCYDGAAAFGYLDRLSIKGKKGHRSVWFVKSMAAELQSTVERYGRLAMKERAFINFRLLLESRFSDLISESRLNELYGRELVSPVIQVVRNRLRGLREKVFRLAEKDSALGKILKSAKERMEDSPSEDSDNDFDDSSEYSVDDVADGFDEYDEYDDFDDFSEDGPSNDTLAKLPRMEKEVKILTWIEDTLLDKEVLWAKQASTSAYMQLFNDPQLLSELETLLDEAEPLLDKFADYSLSSVSEVKDFISSFLPGAIRDKVCNDEYLDVVRMESEFERKLLVFVRRAYGR